jgi:ribose transport system permease protein
MFSAFTASLAGVILAGRMLSAQPQMGTGYELQVIAAVVLGGVSLTMGGVGKLHGTIVGVLLLGILSNGLSMLNVGSFWQQIAKGTLFLVAVFFDSLRSRSYKKA